MEFINPFLADAEKEKEIIAKREVQAFIDRNKSVFDSVARDMSLKLVPGEGFYIDLEKGHMSVDTKFFMEYKEKGCTETQIVWAVFHEIMHFRDLMSDPRGMLQSFEHIERKACELAPQVLEIWKKKLGDPLPDYLTSEIPFGSSGRTVNYAEYFVYKALHRQVYNAADDMYVNQNVARIPSYGRGSPGAAETKRLYRDYLFATNSKKPGEPPVAMEPYDMTGSPRSYQMIDVLLRRQMVPDQEILMHEDVRKLHESARDEIARRYGITFAREVADMVTPAREENKKCSDRYRRIRQNIEPVFIKMFLEDVKTMDPPKPPPPPGNGPPPPPGKEKEKKPDKPGGDPWNPNDKPENVLDADKVRDFIKQQKKKEKADKEKEEERQKIARMTPQERMQYERHKEDRELAKKKDLSPDVADQYNQLVESVSPYVKELKKVFDRFMSSVREHITRAWASGFRSGRLDLEHFIDKYGPELAAGLEAQIPWDSLDDFEQKQYESRFMLLPNKIKVRLVIDDSGSMSGDRIHAARQLMVLFMEALGRFELYMNQAFRLKEEFRVNLEVWSFSSKGAARKVKEITRLGSSTSVERAGRFRALDALQAGGGATCDAEPLWKIAESVTPAQREEIKRGKTRDFVFLITDGGSSGAYHDSDPGLAARADADPDKKSYTSCEGAIDSRDALAALEKIGITARGIQIGAITEDEGRKRDLFTFRRTWGEDGDVVEHPKDLPEKLAKMLISALEKIEPTLEFYEGDDLEPEMVE